jgi:hypothetical protein
MRKSSLIALPALFLAGAALAEGTSDPQSNRNSANDPAAAAADADTFEVEIATGADYSIGDYGAALDTRVWSVPLDLKVRSGRFRAEASLPWVHLKGPGQIVGGVVVQDPAGGTASRSGIGDLNLSTAYMITTEEGAMPTLELGGAVKVPTAKTTIGTGELDWSLTASVYKSVGSGVMLFGSVGYSWLGSPAAYSLKNGVMASGGLNYQREDGQNYGVSLAWREPVATGYQGQAVVSPYMTYRFSKRLGLTLYGMAGLNDASPRAGGGLRLSVFP